ncbi:hypothetical protein HYX10_01190 [Candidatus Woesearchaeota archaeon]|nr:hypothetical protein [Candidatus Woesearchaeota archaeon]
MKKIAVVISKKDAAGLNIAEQLQRLHNFPAVIGSKKVELHFCDEYIVNPENIDQQIDAEIFIFGSRHVSRAGVHSLSVHSIGNWGKVAEGGKDRTLIPAPAALMKECFTLLRQKAEGMDYEVILEATHHGPYLEKPAMFIEIGSDEERWNDEKAGKVIATTIIEAIGNLSSSKNRSNDINAVVGVGGLHHAPNFAKAMLAEGTAVSYICPKYMLGSLDEEMLRQAAEKSVPRATQIVLDWKGLGKEKAGIVRICNHAGLALKRTSDFGITV